MWSLRHARLAALLGLGLLAGLGSQASAAKQLTSSAAVGHQAKAQRAHAGHRAHRARRPPGRSSARREILWGAQIGPQFTGEAAPWDMAAVSDFQRLVGKAPSIVTMNLPFEGCSPSCNYYAFPKSQLSAVRAYGAIPMLNWSSMSSPLQVDEPAFRLNKVASGAYDSYIRSFALAAKEWGHPFFLRFDWEMNGNWFPWAEAANGNHPGDFVAAWRHVHDIFASVGASNVTWVWCPVVDPHHEYGNITELYPGQAYVNWSCLDGYNFGGNSGSGWSTFDQIYSSSYERLASVAAGKPMMIGEVASSEHGGAKAAWITDMLAKVANAYTDLRAVVWFDWAVGSDDWPIETSSSSTAAFARGIAQPSFTSNTFGELAAGPITPPS
jgi:hypothetical protein